MERYQINRDVKNCGDCIMLRKVEKIDQNFCGKTGFNIKVTLDCDTGPVKEKPKPDGSLLI